MMRAKPIQTAKWGTACAQCAAAKAKCSRQSGTQGSRCDRCERLLKQCTDQVHRPRKSRQPKQQSPYRSRDNPGGFDGFRDTASSSAHSPSLSDLGASSASSIGDPISTPPSPQGRTPTLARTSSTLHAYTPSGTADCLCQLQGPAQEGQAESDQRLLDVFRTELMPHYPFVSVPYDANAETLQAQQPFLMSAIRMVASLQSTKSARRQLHNIMNHLANHMLLRAERSTDLLMGVIVVLGWYHYQCMRHSQFNNLLCLAESLAADLGLWRGGAERTNEDKRLLLGVWYLRSSAAVHFHLLDSIPWTNTLSQYAADLEQGREYPSDLLLVELVSIQQVTERVAALEEPTEASGQDSTIPELQAKLDGMFAMASGYIATTHINTALLRLHEVKSELPSQQPLATIKAWFEWWNANIPPSIHHALPTTVIFQLVCAVVLLYRRLGCSPKNTLAAWLDDQRDLVPSGTPLSRSASPASPRQHRGLAVSDAMAALQSHMAQMGIKGAEMVEYMIALGIRRGSESGLLSAAMQRRTTTISDAALSTIADRFAEVMLASSAAESGHDIGQAHPVLEAQQKQVPLSFEYSYDYPVASIEDSLPGLQVSQILPSSASPLATSQETQWATGPCWDWTSQLTPQANVDKHGGIMGVEDIGPQLWFDATAGQQHDQNQGKTQAWEFDQHFSLGFGSGGV